MNTDAHNSQKVKSSLLNSSAAIFEWPADGYFSAHTDVVLTEHVGPDKPAEIVWAAHMAQAIESIDLSPEEIVRRAGHGATIADVESLRRGVNAILRGEVWP